MASFCSHCGKEAEIREMVAGGLVITMKPFSGSFNVTCKNVIYLFSTNGWTARRLCRRVLLCRGAEFCPPICLQA